MPLGRISGPRDALALLTFQFQEVFSESNGFGKPTHALESIEPLLEIIPLCLDELSPHISHLVTGDFVGISPLFEIEVLTGTPIDAFVCHPSGLLQRQPKNAFGSFVPLDRIFRS
jgi:hypothetical protein